MLVLSRKAGQEILIGDNISIIINKVAGDRVSIAIKAPDNVRILRGELKSFAEQEELAAGEVLPLGDFLPSNSQPTAVAS
jgi:carbon storage regulator